MTTSATYVIHTQNLEEYGTDFHKFKGGSTYNVHFDLKELIFEEDAFGPGKHQYYKQPSLSQASVAALVMQHVNRYNGLQGSFDYITSIETVSLFDTPDHPDFNGRAEDLIQEINQAKEAA
jgi:hypothetical protein